MEESNCNDEKFFLDIDFGSIGWVEIKTAAILVAAIVSEAEVVAPKTVDWD